MRASLSIPRAIAAGGRNLGLLATLILGLLIISIFSPQYLSVDNLLVVALQVSFVGIAALGTAYLIISGNIDLSIGSQYAVCAVASALLSKSLPSPFAWLAGILLGALLGLVNGLLVWRITISPIIITLGTLTIYRGAALRITNGFGVRGVPKSFSDVWTSPLAGPPDAGVGTAGARDGGPVGPAVHAPGKALGRVRW